MRALAMVFVSLAAVLSGAFAKGPARISTPHTAKIVQMPTKKPAIKRSVKPVLVPLTVNPCPSTVNVSSRGCVIDSTK